MTTSKRKPAPDLHPWRVQEGSLPFLASQFSSISGSKMFTDTELEAIEYMKRVYSSIDSAVEYCGRDCRFSDYISPMVKKIVVKTLRRAGFSVKCNFLDCVIRVSW